MPRRTHLSPFTLAVLAVPLVAACGQDSVTFEARDVATPASSTVQPASSSSSVPAAVSSADVSSAAVSSTNVSSANASPAAGITSPASPGSAPASTTPVVTTASAARPVPSGAIRLEARDVGYGTSAASLRTPTGNIGCDFTVDGRAGCAVHEQDWKPADDGYMWVALDAPAGPTTRLQNDVPDSAWPGVTVLQYGRSATFGSFACTSAFEGLTCWNTTTGHGAFMSRQEYRPF